MLSVALHNLFDSKNITIFHRFHTPPYGGGNQFLLALKTCFEQQGYRIRENAVTHKTGACLFNSFNFDFAQVYAVKRKYPHIHMIHRIDGPISVYRGYDDQTDQRIWQINHDLADATVFQSHYSARKHSELGLIFRNPTVIHNAVDHRIFNREGKMPYAVNRKIRLISTSWSDNARKGGAAYQWLDQHLDFERYEYTFVGRLPEANCQMKHIRILPPVPSEVLANILKQHDIYLTATQNDSCSNALIEALACGLPAIYANSGGSPELVGAAGFGFESYEEIPTLLSALIARYEEIQRKIVIDSIESVAEKYAALFHATRMPRIRTILHTGMTKLWRTIRNSIYANKR